MITETLINTLLQPIIVLLANMETLSINIPRGVENGIVSLTSGLAYIFPMKSIIPIIGIRLGIQMFHISWSLILRIKSFIPTMGN